MSVLATKATKFFQLMAVSFSELTPGAPMGATYVTFRSMRPVGFAECRPVSYLLFDADMQPPPELREFEVDASRLPPLKTVLGTGASASVYKVANFLPQCLEQFIAVKAFSYNLQHGLAEHADDFRRFKLELFISSRLEHPNIVKTYGTVLFTDP